MVLRINLDLSKLNYTSNAAAVKCRGMMKITSLFEDQDPNDCLKKDLTEISRYMLTEVYKDVITDLSYVEDIVYLGLSKECKPYIATYLKMDICLVNNECSAELDTLISQYMGDYWL